MEAFTAIASAISAVAALGALIFAWLTVRQGRTARREEHRAREIERLHRLLEYVGAVAEADAVDRTPQVGIAQLRLETALAGWDHLTECRKLASVETADSSVVFEQYLDAREEVHRELTRRV